MEPCPSDINEAPGDPTLSSLQRLDLKIERAKAILDKYESLIFGEVEVSRGTGVSFEPFDEYDQIKRDGYERLELKVFIQVVLVTEEQIPRCLEGVPVHFVIGPEAKAD